MTSSPRASRQPLSVPANSLATDTEGGRAFFQERLTIWAKLGFLLTFSFFVLENLLSLLSLAPFRGATVQLLHLTVVVIWGAAWFALRWGPLPRRVLRAIDPGIVLAGCPISVLYTTLHDPVQYYTYLPPLIVFIGSVGRAIFVPSTALRTFAVSLGIATAVHVVTAVFAPALELPRWFPVDEMRIWTLIFSFAAIVLATVASRVIYGLRQEIRKVRQLGQYTLEERLGEGGMGIVYRAHHAMLRRPTAIKLLPPEKAGEGSLERFEREVQLTALLSHPNTVAIFDYGRTPDGIFYYAMELLDGIDLERLIAEEGPMPVERALRVLQQVCGALSEAHGIGLVHRDIKPANIILCDRGGEPDVAKVVDFGLVKDIAHPGASASLTDANVLVGTPHYMAPESITRPEDADARADLYALGAVGYYLISAKPVFDATTIVEVCSHHLHTPAPPLPERAEQPVSEDVASLLRRCLAKDPADRPNSAQELKDALAATGIARAWTSERATEWWKERRAGTEKPSTTAVPSSFPPTLAIDFAERIAK